jgi:hypothetical protein
VSPYLVAVVAFANQWLYENGVLCYLRGLELRILDLHHSEKTEIVVDFQKLMCEILAESPPRTTFDLQLLHYSHGIVSCTYSIPDAIPSSVYPRRHSDCTHRLLVFNPVEGQIITIRRLQSVSRLFIRNNDRFLYYGTTSEPDHDGYEQWIICGFDIAAGRWLDHQLDIPEVIGTDIGSTVCFEIFDDYFYVLSNQRSLDVEELDWLSYYTCFRFPLARDGFRRVKEPPREQLWRRDHTEGPIDDRWTFLRLVRDEVTGHFKAVESRREWLNGRISGRRTYYTTPIRFNDAGKYAKEHHPMADTASCTAAAKIQQGGAARKRARDPHAVHPGDDNSVVAATLAKCAIRSYYPSSQTSIDVVDVSTTFDPADRKLRLRGNTRRLWTPAELAERNYLPAAERSQDQDAFLRQIDDLYRSEYGVLWPPEQDPSAPDPALANLHAILNPPGHLGGLQGSWDERSMVYTTGTTVGGLRALVFVSWDPSIYLPGTAPYPGSSSLGRAGNWTDGNPMAVSTPPAAKTAGEGKGKDIDTTERHPTLQPDATLCAGGGFTSPETCLSGGRGASLVSWTTFEPAQYCKISQGYHFAR